MKKKDQLEARRNPVLFWLFRRGYRALARKRRGRYKREVKFMHSSF
jgi:hypothetical protein